MATAAAAGCDEVAVRVGRLGILVEVLHVRMGGRAVEVEVILLHILTVVALAVGEAEEPFLENRILAVPESQRKAEALFVIGNAGDAVLAPAVGARAGLVVGEEIPGITPLTIVFAHRSPLALSEVGPPFLPRDLLLASLFKSDLFIGFHHYALPLF